MTFDGMPGALQSFMIDALISLKIIFLMVLATLVLDEIFVGIQTTESVNFFASRATLVELDPLRVDDFFNHTILERLIFTRENPFFSIHLIQSDPSVDHIQSIFHITSRLAPKGFDYQTTTERIHTK